MEERSSAQTTKIVAMAMTAIAGLGIVIILGLGLIRWVSNADVMTGEKKIHYGCSTEIGYQDYCRGGY